MRIALGTLGTEALRILREQSWIEATTHGESRGCRLLSRLVAHVYVACAGCTPGRAPAASGGSKLPHSLDASLRTARLSAGLCLQRA